MASLLQWSAWIVCIYLLLCWAAVLAGAVVDEVSSRPRKGNQSNTPVAGGPAVWMPRSALGDLVGASHTVLITTPIYILVGRLQGLVWTVGDSAFVSRAGSNAGNMMYWFFTGVPFVLLLVVGAAAAAVLGGWAGANFGARNTLAMWAMAAFGAMALGGASNVWHGAGVPLDEPVPALRSLVDWIVGVVLVLAILWLPGMWLGVRLGRRSAPTDRTAAPSDDASVDDGNTPASTEATA